MHTHIKMTLFFILVLPTGCKQDIIEIPPIIEGPDCTGVYEDYSTADFDFIKQHLVAASSVGPFFIFPEPYLYENPVFNPCNSNQIAYSRKIPTELQGEVWTFDFCTGEANMVSDNFYYNLDWGYNGWLLYTGEGHQIYKVKASGDSLTQLSNQSGFNRAGKWNPTGTVYMDIRDDGAYLHDFHGNEIKRIETIPFGPIDWVDDTTLLGWRNEMFHSLTVSEETLVPLNHSSVCWYCAHIYMHDNATAKVVHSNGVGAIDYYLSYLLSGINQVDTIQELFDSYSYSKGDYANNKIVTTLYRQHWQDSIENVRYARWNILIMDADGTNERLVELP